MDTQCDKKSSPEWVQDMVAKAYIDRLLYRDDINTMQYSLDIPDYSKSLFQREGKTVDGVTTLSSASKPAKKAYTSPAKLKSAAKASKALRSATDIKFKPEKNRAKKLGEHYVARLFESKGYEVAMMPKGMGYDILVMPADFSKTMKVDVYVDQQINSPVIGIKICSEFLGDEFSIGINDTLADFYVIKICGAPGAYVIGTDALKNLVKEKTLKDTKVTPDNYQSTSAILNKKLVLDKAIYIG